VDSLVGKRAAGIGCALAVAAAIAPVRARAQGAGAPVDTSDKGVCATASEDAQALRSAGRLVEARAKLLVCTRPNCPNVVKQDCEAWLTSVDAALPSLVLGAKGPNGEDLVDVRVTVDDKPFVDHLSGLALPIDPGAHALRFEADGRVPVDVRLLVREGEHQRDVAVTFDARGQSDAGPRVPPWAFVTGTLAVASLGEFVAMELVAAGDARGLRATCAPRCAAGDVDRVSNETIAANLGLVAAGVFTAATAAIWYFGRPSAPRAAALVGPTRVGLRVEF
jgi:hypothetical protein